jgi:hypothetical protein
LGLGVAGSQTAGVATGREIGMVGGREVGVGRWVGRFLIRSRCRMLISRHLAGALLFIKKFSYQTVFVTPGLSATSGRRPWSAEKWRGALLLRIHGEKSFPHLCIGREKAERIIILAG